MLRIGSSAVNSDSGANQVPSAGPPGADSGKNGKPARTLSFLYGRHDLARVLAEFWADGPHSETTPGHWNTLANQASDHPLFEKRFRGAGPRLEALERDVKLYVSGHSTFSRAAAEVLTAITGSPFFPGGLATHTAALLVAEDEGGTSGGLQGSAPGHGGACLPDPVGEMMAGLIFIGISVRLVA